MLPAWILPLLMAVPCAWAVWERRRRRTELGARIWLLERERESAARRAVEEERARVARDLHDIVSHSVSVMVVQAGAARHGLDGEGGLNGEAEEALLAVERTGREAMTELRHLLGLLAPDPDGDDAFAPQPSLARLSTLVDRVAFAGLPVEVTVTGEPRPLPAGIEATAYRVVQEALTNALKHGTPGARAELRVSYGTRNLRLEVLSTGPSVLTGSGPAPPENRDGRGLAGLRERVALYGGDLDARRRLGGGYRVRARIPLERP